MEWYRYSIQYQISILNRKNALFHLRSVILISGRTSNQKLELSVAGASDPSTRVQKLIGNYELMTF